MNIYKGTCISMIFVTILFLSCQQRPQRLLKYELQEIHTEIVGKDSVKAFHKKFPFIVSDNYVYLAYLQREYYKSQKINQLIKNDYYKRTMSEFIQGNRFRQCCDRFRCKFKSIVR